MKNRRWKLKFRRWLHEDLQSQLGRLQDIVYRCCTNGDRDRAVWDWEKSGVFSVKSTYNHLCKNDYGHNNNKIWKAKLPIKIKIFLWLVCQNAILTKYNLCKRKWKGNKSCAFCTEDENVQHIFFGCLMAKYVWSILAFSLGADCRPSNIDQYWIWVNKILPYSQQMHAVGLAAICWALWRSRNAACFEKKHIKSPTEIVCMICSFLTYWAGLLKEDMQAQVIQGAAVVKSAALFFHSQGVQMGAGQQMVPYDG